MNKTIIIIPKYNFVESIVFTYVPQHILESDTYNYRGCIECKNDGQQGYVKITHVAKHDMISHEGYICLDCFFKVELKVILVDI